MLTIYPIMALQLELDTTFNKLLQVSINKSHEGMGHLGAGLFHGGQGGGLQDY